VPPVADHVTAVLLVPLTVAENCWVPPVKSEAEVGLMPIETSVTVTVADADLVVSATLVAVTVNVPAVFGAVYRPVDETVPPVVDHVTAVLLLPVTVAVNCCVRPVKSEAVVGLMLTATTGGGALTVTVAAADFEVSAVLVARTVKAPAVAGAV
jgi:hypothetical protein